MSVLQRFGPGLVPADLLRGFAPEPLGVGHRGREVGLVLAAARGQRPAAPAPESAPLAGGHVRPAGRASSPGGRGRGQGPPESPGAGDFATLQPRWLHRCRWRPPPGCAARGPEPTPRATPGALATSWSPRGAGGRRGQIPRCAQSPGVWQSHWSRREKPTWSSGGSHRLQRGRGGGRTASPRRARAAPRETRRLCASPAPRLRLENRPHAAERPPFSDAQVPLRWGRRTQFIVFQQTSSAQLLGVGLWRASRWSGRASARSGNPPSWALRPSPWSVEFCFFLFKTSSNLGYLENKRLLGKGCSRISRQLWEEEKWREVAQPSWEVLWGWLPLG